MPKQLSDERQAAELAKLLREIARDLGAGILATDVPAPFKKARGLCTMLDHGWTPTSGVYDADHPAVRFFKKRYGVNVTGHSFSGASINPCPPDVQTARVRAVRALLWRFQECAQYGHKADADDLAKLLTLADSLQPTAKAPDGDGKSVGQDSDVDKQQARNRAKMKWLSEAMTIVTERGKLMSDAMIARLVGKHPSTLSRNGTYQRAAAAAREGLRITKGSKDGDGNLEAEA